MNNTDQQTYYSNTAASYFVPNTNMEQSHQFPVRNPVVYGPRMNPAPFISPQMTNGYGQQILMPFPQQLIPGNNPRGITPPFYVRPPNENYPTFVSQSGFPSTFAPGGNNLSSTSTNYPQPFYTPYPVPQNYPTQQGPTHVPNQTQIPPQPQYPISGVQQQQAHSSQPIQHIDQQNISTSQSSIPQSTPYVSTTTSTSVVPEKRQKKPLIIVDPNTNKPVEVSTATTTVSTVIPSTTNSESHSTDSITMTDSSTSNTNKTQIQEVFRRQVAEKLGDASNVQIEKNVKQQSAPTESNEELSDIASTKQDTTKQLENVVSQLTSSAPSSRSGSISRTKSPIPVSSDQTSTTPSKESTSSKSSEHPQPGRPGIMTRNINDDISKIQTNSANLNNKQERSDEQKEQESEPIQLPEATNTDSPLTFDEPLTKDDDEKHPKSSENQTTLPLSSTTLLGNINSSQTLTSPINNKEIRTAPNQRLRYDRYQLLSIRDNSAPFPIPPNLPDLDIVINRRDNVRLSYSGTGSQGRMNPSPHRQTSLSNHPSLTRYPHLANDSKRRPPVLLPPEPDFGNRATNPYRPADHNKIDANNKVLRDVKSILNKVTPQTYDKLQKQLESLEIDRYERLEGMITIFFSKAVDEPAFSFLYAKLCKQFQKKQVTVPGEDGKTVTHYFRQILLTRCQKEFENDYRQEIEYERRKIEVENIEDEKKQKEEAEKLEEDLLKAKRRKLGNIFFIGELFKLQMLTDTIMYDCIEYLLRDKIDEEALECLCRLLRTIGKELDAKANEKPVNKSNLEKHYRELDNIVKEQKTSARIRFMIQDLIELRQALWVARRAESKPTTIDEIHENERLRREQQERDQDRPQRRDPTRPNVIGTLNIGNNQQQYNDARGSRGSGIKQTSNRTDEDRVENRFNVKSVRELQSNDKRNQGQLAMNLAPQRTWTKGSGIEKKPEDDRLFPGRSSKPPPGPIQQLKGKSGSSQGSSYPVQRQSSRELARENSQRDRENALQSLRKTTTNSGMNSPISATGSSSITNSREGSCNVSREQSRNASRESSVSERASNVSSSVPVNKMSTNEPSTVINQDPSHTSFDEEKIQARVHSLIEEYTENYSESTDRPVQEALEDLSAFRTPIYDQQAIIVRELFTNVFEAKPRARKAVGHLLDPALHRGILSTEAFLSGFKIIVESAPEFAVDIPLIWQYIGEIIGALIGAPTSNISLLKPILQCVPDDKLKQLFEYIIRYAAEFSSQMHIQKLWQSSGFSLNDLIKFDPIDPSFSTKCDWLFDTSESELVTNQSKENLFPRADPQLVKLFKSVNDQNTTVTDPEIITYIREHMNSNEKFYIRNIVLSYLEACLINREPQKKIQEDIAKKRMSVLNAIIEHKPEAEIQAVYAIQNFVNQLEHPPKMARLLFDIFYDEECVSEDAFFEWLKHPDQSETEGHAVVEMSTKDFFTWLQQAETEVEEGEEEEEGN